MFQTVMIIREVPKNQEQLISHIVNQIQQEIPSQIMSSPLTKLKLTLKTYSIKVFKEQIYLSNHLIIMIPFLKKNLEKVQTTNTTLRF